MPPTMPTYVCRIKAPSGASACFMRKLLQIKYQPAPEKPQYLLSKRDIQNSLLTTLVRGHILRTLIGAPCNKACSSRLCTGRKSLTTNQQQLDALDKPSLQHGNCSGMPFVGYDCRRSASHNPVFFGHRLSTEMYERFLESNRLTAIELQPRDKDYGEFAALYRGSGARAGIVAPAAYLGYVERRIWLLGTATASTHVCDEMMETCHSHAQGGNDGDGGDPPLSWPLV